jgi:hypothetical protein
MKITVYVTSLDDADAAVAHFASSANDVEIIVDQPIAPTAPLPAERQERQQAGEA